MFQICHFETKLWEVIKNYTDFLNYVKKHLHRAIEESSSIHTLSVSVSVSLSFFVLVFALMLKSKVKSPTLLLSDKVTY